MSTNTIKPAVEALNSRLQSLSSEASAEETAYISTAIEKVAGQATVFDVMNTGEAAKEGIQQFYENKIAEFNKNISNNCVPEIKIVDQGVFDLSSDESYGGSGSPTYRSVVKENNNSFGICALLQNSGTGRCQATLTPFLINENGNIEKGLPSSIWDNSSYHGISTTYFISSEGTGKIFAAGNNSYPGQTGHKKGYFYASLKNNKVINKGYVVDEKSHMTNGAISAFKKGNGFEIMYAGTDHATNKARAMMLDYSGDVPVVNAIDISANSSNCQPVSMLPQEGVSPVLSKVVIYQKTNKKYCIKSWSDDLSGVYETSIPVNYGVSQTLSFLLSNGNVVLYTPSGGYLFSDYNRYERLDIPKYFNNSAVSGCRFNSLGGDKWLGFDHVTKCIFVIYINSETGIPEVVDSYSLNGLIYSDVFNGNSKMLTAGSGHKYLVFLPAVSSANKQPVIVIENPLSV